MLQYVWLTVVIAALSTSGCASVKVKKLSSEDEKGVRFYRPAPYLLKTEELQRPPMASRSWNVILNLYTCLITKKAPMWHIQPSAWGRQISA